MPENKTVSIIAKVIDATEAAELQAGSVVNGCEILSITDGIDWSSVDWSMGNTEIAESLDSTGNLVRYMRTRLEMPKCLSDVTGFRNWLNAEVDGKMNKDIILGMCIPQIITAYGTDISTANITQALMSEEIYNRQKESVNGFFFGSGKAKKNATPKPVKVRKNKKTAVQEIVQEQPENVETESPTETV